MSGTLVLVDDGVPEHTIRSLTAAAVERDVDVRVVEAAEHDFRAPPLEPDTMLYTPATSLLATRVERQLYQPGVVTFYLAPASPWLLPVEDERRLMAAGVSAPRSVWVGSPDPERLDAAVEALGGYPLIVKVPGGAGGVGVMRAEARGALVALVEFLREHGHSVQLRAWVEPRTVWRVIVVGDRAVAAYENPLRVADFRSYASEDPAAYTATPEPELAALAVNAAHAVGTTLAGVDVVEHPSGRLYVLECNFPLYFGHAEETGGISVAGPMVDWLMKQRCR